MLTRNQWYKLLVLVYLIGWFVGSFWLIGMIKSGTVKYWWGVELSVVEEYAYYALAGAIGGTLYALRLFHEYYDNITERWVVWYLLRPIKCAGVAVVTIILFHSGIMLLQTADTPEAKMGIAFLVGFGYGKVLDKLRALTETLFNGNGKYGANGTNGGTDGNGGNGGNGGNNGNGGNGSNGSNGSPSGNGNPPEKDGTN
ncbi:hypothetical protein [Paenibacillus cremeus]|uniref:hypothetical protein n=1 Tax=Paenibacillus cremeus TaxID=2163881 RepID=UPI0021BDD4BA|nr:hypothetical protein [Paenibacillus cremeus]